MQFPTNNSGAWEDAVRDRYEEFDSDESVLLHARAASIAVDSGRLGESVVYVTNSVAGLRAQMPVAKANGTNVRELLLMRVWGVYSLKARILRDC